MSTPKEKAWQEYKLSESFESDGRANGFNKGFEAGQASRPITAERWNDVLGQRDHLIAALRDVGNRWNTDSEACADNSAVAFEMAKIARDALAYLKP